MTDFVKGCRAKLRWIDRHLVNLEELVKTHKANSHRLIRDVDLEVLQIVHRVVDLRPPDEDIALLVGDIAYDMASCLDQLIYGLGQEYSPGVTFKTAFPIFTCPARFRKEAKIKTLNPTDQTILELLQPYHAAAPDESPLIWLYDINLIDKHRYGYVVDVFTFGGGMGFDGNTVCAFNHIPPVVEEDTVISYVRFANLADLRNSKIEHELVCHVKFGHDCGAATGRPILETLQAIRAHLDDCVFDSKGLLAGRI